MTKQRHIGGDCPSIGMGYMSTHPLPEQLKQEIENQDKPIPMIIIFDKPPSDDDIAKWVPFICKRCVSNKRIITSLRPEHLSAANAEEKSKAQIHDNPLDPNPAEVPYRTSALQYPLGKRLTGKYTVKHSSINKDTHIYCPGDCSICTYVYAREP